MPIHTTLTVTYQCPMWHRWADAPDHRAYLRHSHRHMMHWTAAFEVGGNDRELEFHDLRDTLKGVIHRVLDGHEQWDCTNRSCEAMAVIVLSELLTFNIPCIQVTCSEDNEFTGTATWRKG